MTTEFKNEDLYCYVKNAKISDENPDAKFHPFVLNTKCQLGNVDLVFWVPEKLGIEKTKKETWPSKRGDFLKISIVNFNKAEKEYKKSSGSRDPSLTLQGNYDSNFKYKVINEEDVPEEIFKIIYCDKKNQIEFAKNHLKDYIKNEDFWQNKELCKLLKDSIEKNPEFIKCPAAIKKHHAYEGGLLVHTSEVNFLCNAIADACSKLYPNANINRDVINLSSWLHDIGKIETYSLDEDGDPNIFGEKENKLNHILRSLTIFSRVAEKYNLNSEFVQEVNHCIASHQDRIEWKTPVEPISLEAIILAKADKISSELAKNE